MIHQPPEPGQLVEVRRRQWIAVDARASAPLAMDGDGQQHLVDLTAIDEDSLGEMLSVVWELEPGARVLDTAGLPKVDRWDDCGHLEAFLDAVRWGASTNADRALLQAPFRSGIDIQSFQLDPLVRAVDMARVNLLIADDVGLGKTIEAGLVIQELIARHRARSVLVVCPASLQMKWRDEMREKFGLDFRIVDTAYIKRLRRERGIHANPWTSFPRLIASMDWMKSGEGYRLLKDVLPPHISYPRKFDILVVDEAHNVAPSSSSRYAIPSQRTNLIRRLAPHFEHKIFLSATPHNGYTESFTGLLELLDDQRFARTAEPDPRQLQRVMVRRLKTDLVDESGNPIYPRRELLPLEVEYSSEERDAHHLLRQYTASRSETVEETRADFGTDFIHKLLKKRLFSSPRAFATTLAKHRESITRGGRRKDSSGLRERILRKAIARTREDYADDGQVEEAEIEAVETASEMAAALTNEQAEMLKRLSAWADAAKNRADSKAAAILAWLDGHLKTDGDWNDRRVILFTEYRATHAWLMEILASHGWGGDRLMCLHGGTDLDEREKIKAAFQTHPDDSPVRILLATDAASEGIDLQNHCHFMIHIEVPWNPNVMEQRNGRIDRHGQKQDAVCIWHPVPKGTDFDELRTLIAEGHDRPIDLSSIEGEAEYLVRAVLKVEQMREDLGCVGPVIAQQVEEAMLGQRGNLDTSLAEARAAEARKYMVAERRLQERITRLHERLLEARDGFQLTPDRVSRAVSVALEVTGKPPLGPANLDRGDGDVFSLPLLTGSWAQAAEGLAHPHTGRVRPITFDHSIAQGHDDVVLAHLQHRLVQLSLRLLRAEVWAPEDTRRLARVAVRVLPDGVTEDPVVIVWSRLVVTGGGHHRLHEELTMSGGELKPDRFTRIRTLSRMEELLQAGTPHSPSEGTFSLLQERYEQHNQSVVAAIEARSRDRLQYLANTIDRRRQSEEADIEQVLDDLEAMIRRELDEAAKPKQLTFEFTVQEREQIRQDLDALRRRLERIPEERQKEVESIRRRYADPADRTFPVAIEFLVPEKMLKKEGA
jgi:superfamily II DNA or RNA helicase